jgi:hypothetical protein
MLSPAGMTDILPSGGPWPGAGPVDVVVIGTSAVGVVEVPAVDEEDAVDALAPGAGNSSLADRSHAVHGPAL